MRSPRYKCPVVLTKIESLWPTRYPATRRTPEKRNSFEENYEKEEVPGLARMPNPLVSQLRYALDDQIYHEKNGGLKKGEGTSGHANRQEKYILFT